MEERFHDCEPTLTDEQVIEFCKNGFLIYKAAIPREINERIMDFLGSHTHVRLDEILDDEWFVDGLLKNPQVCGAVRSLLGKNYKLPMWIYDHRKECPDKHVCGWHRDGGGIVTPRVNYLALFYYPQDTPKALGPTGFLPGSHFVNGSRRFMKHVGKTRSEILAASPAGTVVITHYPILHKRTTATATGIRHMFHYHYWRTTPPNRDWIIDPGFDVESTEFKPDASVHEKWWSAIQPARMYSWLCGLGDDIDFKGGQNWPVHKRLYYDEPIEGIPQALRTVLK